MLRFPDGCSDTILEDVVVPFKQVKALAYLVLSRERGGESLLFAIPYNCSSNPFPQSLVSTTKLSCGTCSAPDRPTRHLSPASCLALS